MCITPEDNFVLRFDFHSTSYPAYKTSVGRVFLSWMGDPGAQSGSMRITKDDISMTQEEFLAMLHRKRPTRRLRARRPGVQRGSAMRGGPRFPHRQQADVTISISAPLSRMDGHLRSRELVTDFAARISHDIQAAEAGLTRIAYIDAGQVLSAFFTLFIWAFGMPPGQNQPIQAPILRNNCPPTKNRVRTNSSAPCVRYSLQQILSVQPNGSGFLPHWIPVSSSYSFWETSPIWEWLISYSLPS